MNALGASVKVSVVIPTHNRLGGLASAISSLAQQTALPDEIVIVDDGSDKAVTHEIFRDIPESVRTTLLRNESPRGANHARNRGILSAAGDYIAFLDDDDTFKPKKIEILKKVIAENPHVDLIYHPAHVHMVNEGVSYFTKPREFREGEDAFRRLLISNVIGGTPMVAVRRKSLLEAGLFDEKMPALQDYELWIRLAKNKSCFYFLSEPLTDYMQETKSKSITKNNDAIMLARSLMDEKYKDFLADKAVDELKKARFKSDILRFSLNGNMWFAFRRSLYAYSHTKDVVFLASALSSLVGRRLFFKLFVIDR